MKITKSLYLVFILLFSSTAQAGKWDEFLSLIYTPRAGSLQGKLSNHMSMGRTTGEDWRSISRDEKKYLEGYLSSPSRTIADLPWFRDAYAKDSGRGRALRTYLFTGLDESSLTVTNDLTDSLFEAAEFASKSAPNSTIQNSRKWIWKDFFNALNVAIESRVFQGKPGDLIAAMVTRASSRPMRAGSIENGKHLLENKASQAITKEFEQAVLRQPRNVLKDLYGSPHFRITPGHPMAFNIFDSLDSADLYDLNIFRRWVLDTQSHLAATGSPEPFKQLLGEMIQQDQEILKISRQLAEEDRSFHNSVRSLLRASY